MGKDSHIIWTLLVTAACIAEYVTVIAFRMRKTRKKKMTGDNRLLEHATPITEGRGFKSHLT